jgi:hypothetical protein
MHDIIVAVRRLMELVVERRPRCRQWHFFYAGPAPLAVALGQQISPTMMPLVQLYEFRFNQQPQYKPSTTINS